MLRALASVRDARRQAAALALVLDPKLDPREALQMLFTGGREANLAVAQAFFQDHRDAILKGLPPGAGPGPFARLAALLVETCEASKRDEVIAKVHQTFAGLPGGPRIIAQSLEQLDPCIARKHKLEPEIRAWLTGATAKPARSAKP